MPASGFPPRRDYYDISVAVSTPKGLVVPVLRDVDKLSFADVEKVSLCPYALCFNWLGAAWRASSSALRIWRRRALIG